MAFNFSKIIENEMKRAEENTGASRGRYPLVYPYNTGRFEFRPIGNEASGLLYRELYYHEYTADGKKYKIPCTHWNWGQDCPICNMVRKIQDLYPNNTTVFRKYGFKRRGVLYVKLLKVDPANYFADNNNPPRVGDIITLLLPKSAIDQLSKCNSEYNTELEEIYTHNTGRVMSLTVASGANGFKSYNFYVQGKTDIICVNDQTGQPDDEAFRELMMNMPDLNEIYYSAKGITNDQIGMQKMVVEQMNREFFGNQVQQPNVYTTPAPGNYQPQQAPAYQPPQQQIPTPQPQMPQVPATELPTNPPMPAPQVQSEAPKVEPPAPAPQAPAPEASMPPIPPQQPEKPACFGNNKYDATCAACPFETQCV